MFPKNLVLREILEIEISLLVLLNNFREVLSGLVVSKFGI